MTACLSSLYIVALRTLAYFYILSCWFHLQTNEGTVSVCEANLWSDCVIKAYASVMRYTAAQTAFFLHAIIGKGTAVKRWIHFYECHNSHETIAFIIRIWSVQSNNVWKVQKSRTIKLFHPQSQEQVIQQESLMCMCTVSPKNRPITHRLTTGSLRPH